MNKVDKKVIKEILDWVLHLGLAAVLALLVVHFAGRPAIVEGNSMLPTLHNRDILIIERLTQRFDEIRPGDIVVLEIPELLGGKEKYAVKRVIAKEGQQVELRDGRVLVDGTTLAEDYINGDETLVEDPMYSDMTVPEGCIYVLGDNRLSGKSRDSRVFGPVNEDRVLGKCWIRLFPFSKFGTVE